MALAIVVGALFAVGGYSNAKLDAAAAADSRQVRHVPKPAAIALARLEFVGMHASVMAPTRTDYAAAMDRAAVVYEHARAQCDPLSGEDKGRCVDEAEAVEIRARAAADVNYHGTVKSTTASRGTDARRCKAGTEGCRAASPPARE